VRNVQVICPGFSADCLETLEEIAMENRDTFLESGGETYEYIPCLNADPEHIDMLAGLVARHTRDWVPAETDAARAVALELRRQLALAAGAKQ
jgi:ferrochelatase